MRLRLRATGEGGRAAYASYAPKAQKRTLPDTEVEPGPLTKSRSRELVLPAPTFGRPIVFEAERKPATAAVVWLHGFSDTPDLRASSLAAERAAHPTWKWIFLRAGRLPIACYKTTSRECYRPSWGDFLDKGTIRPGSKDHESTDPGGWYEASAKLVAGVLEALERDDGVPPSRCVLVGQSQGAASAAHAALQYPRRLAGIAMLQGWLLPAARAALAAAPAPGDGGGAGGGEPASRHAGLQVLVAHGTADEEVDYECATHARRLLRGAGAVCTPETRARTARTARARVPWRACRSFAAAR